MQSKTAKNLFIGITGGIGSGKSLVCSYFEKLGCKIFYADEIARKLYSTNRALHKALVKAFGGRILDEDRTAISFEKLRRVVFANIRNQKRVNSIVHPFVIEELVQRSKKTRARFILVEAALIFESGFDKYLDYTVEVFSPVSQRIKRVKNRNPKLTVKDIRSIIKLQMPENEKVERADFIINNNRDKRSLQREVKLLYQVLKNINH
jgi:dephospho-CoA kinase